MSGFVYCWTDHKTKKLYIGSHKGTENDGYICSSKLMLQEYYSRPLDFSREIIANGSFEEMYKLETEILKSVDARNNINFYNMHNNIPSEFRNKQHTEKTKKKIAKSNTGKKHSLESRKKMAMAKIGKSSWAKGLTKQNDERIKKSAEKHSKTRLLNRDKYSGANASHKTKHSEETILKIKIARANQKNNPLGKHWYTNGKIDVFAFDCPKNFYLGKTNGKRYSKINQGE